MTLFFLLAALLVVLAVALLLAGPLRARANASASAARESDQRATNIALARERRAELLAALEAGQIDRDTHERETEQLELALATDLEASPEREIRDGALPAAVIVAVFVPVTAGALYLHLGDPGALERVPAAPSASNGQASAAGGAGGAPDSGEPARPPALDELLPRLEERLARNPDDLQGWRLLGRSYLGMEEFERAAVALERAVALDDQDAPTLGQLAEALAMGRGGALAGEPVTLLERALAIDPDDPQGLWLRAIAHQQAGEHRDALERFERLRAAIATDTAAVATIDDMMARSRAALGDAAPAAEAPARDAAPFGDTAEGDAAPVGEAGEPAGEPGAGGPDGTSASVSLRVDISPEARDASDPDDTVFIYARASEGPPMPLAVSRRRVADLPLDITLDESMAMMPGMSLADFPTVTLGARVSPSGDAIAAPGDWYAERDGVEVAEEAPVQLLVDTRR